MEIIALPLLIMLMLQLLAIGNFRQTLGQLFAILQTIRLSALRHNLDAMWSPRTEGQHLGIGEPLTTSCHIRLSCLCLHRIAELLLHNEHLRTGRWQGQWQRLWYDQAQHIVCEVGLYKLGLRSRHN